jgi:hypothetical protein
MLRYQYVMGNILILQSDCRKSLGVHSDRHSYFHPHVDFIFSHAMKLLGLICTVTLSVSTICSVLMLYFSLLRSEFEYSSVAGNFIMITH